MDELTINVRRRQGWPAMRIDFDNDEGQIDNIVLSYDPERLRMHLQSTEQSLLAVLLHEAGHVVAAQAGVAPGEEHAWIRKHWHGC